VSIFDRIVEERIRAALEEGKFENLPGKGKPLKMDDNPYEAEEWRTAHTLLRKNGFSLPWLELKKEIEQEIQQARRRLRAARHRQDSDWQAQMEQFSKVIAAINRKILDYNLQAPSAQFHRRVLDPAQEVEAILREEPK
jgi:DnaJ family protein C protein 28